MILLWAFLLTAHAAPLHTTLIYDGAPGDALVSKWSRLGGKHSFLIRLGDPNAPALEPLTRLKGADRLQLSANTYPDGDLLPIYEKIANSQPTEFVSFQGTLPTDDEVRRLNQLPFSRLVLVLFGYPGTEEAARLSQLKTPVEIDFAVPSYPRFGDRESLLAIPANVPYRIATDYWPSYVHMDVLNFLPHQKSVRVTGMYPPEDQMPYLMNIRNLIAAEVEADFDPSEDATWDRFGALSVSWTSRDHVPSPEALGSFEKSTRLGKRRLIIDQDTELDAEDRKRLERLSIPVEWIHSTYDWSF